MNKKTKSQKIIFENTIIPKKILNILNEKSNRKFKGGKFLEKLITNRIKEGYVLEDFEKVISYKCKEWIGTEFEKYLRPETLFGYKFETYLEQTDYEIKSNNYITIRSKSINDIVKFIKCPRTIEEELTEELCEQFDTCEKCIKNWLYKDTLNNC